MIIIILWKNIHSFHIQLLKNFVDHRGFSWTSSACNSDDEHKICFYKYRILYEFSEKLEYDFIYLFLLIKVEKDFTVVVKLIVLYY